MSSAIILGSGTSNGVPMLGVSYPAEFLANPKNHRTRCSVLLRGPEGNVLIDCTPEMRLQMIEAGNPMVDAVIITHSHADHIMGMDDLRSYCIVRGRPMPVYTLPRYQEDIRRIYPYAFQEFPSGIEVPRFELCPVAPTIEAGGLRIQTMIVEHGSLPVIAVRINDFAYVTDVSRIPEPAWAQLQGLDVLVLDAVRYLPHPNHLHYEAAIEVAQQLQATRTYFTHLSHDYDHDFVNSQLPEGIELAFDGLQIPL